MQRIGYLEEINRILPTIVECDHSRRIAPYLLDERGYYCGIPEGWRQYIVLGFGDGLELQGLMEAEDIRNELLRDGYLLSILS